MSDTAFIGGFTAIAAALLLWMVGSTVALAALLSGLAVPEAASWFLLGSAGCSAISFGFMILDDFGVFRD